MMNDERRELRAESDLGSTVAATIAELELPETDLVARVLDDLATTPAVKAGRRVGNGWRFSPPGGGLQTGRPALALAGSVLVILLALLVLEPTRSAVADILGFGATRIDQDSDPDTAPTVTAQVQEPESGLGSDSGSAAPEAGVADGPNPIPSLGLPTVEDGTTGGRRQYSWPASERFPALGQGEVGVILEVRTVAGPADTKSLGGQPGTEFLTVAVESGEAQALWIPNDHLRTPVDGSGTVAVGPTLLWTVDDLQFRLEANVDRDRAVALAAEVIGGTELLGAG